MGERILIIEDDFDLCRILKLNLTRENYKVFTAHDGESGLEAFATSSPDLVIMDISMPKLDGWAVCQQIREQSNVPIMMMTAHAISEADIAHGLNMGADEYMIKPMSEVVFRARVQALLRRAKLRETPKEKLRGYSDTYLSVDIPSRTVTIQNKEIRLTPTEFNLLTLFLQNNGHVLSFGDILENVWGPEYENEHHYPRIYVSHLRKKIEPDYKNPTYIHNEYGVGYVFNSQNS